MNALFEFLGVGGWVPYAIDVALKSAVILLSAFFVTLALRGASASMRHHVWTLAFAAVLALPVLSMTLPSWRVAVPGWEVSAGAAGAWVSATRGGAPASAPQEPVRRSTSLEGPATETLVRAEAASPPAPMRGVESTESLPLAWIWRLALLLWISGTLLLLASLAIGALSAWWTSRAAAPLDDREWRDMIAELRAKIGIRSEVRVLRSPWVGTPMAWGIVRPALLLPDEALTWSAERRRAVALHELAHVKRRDCLVHLLTQAARAVHWMNPLAWIGAKAIRAERERACDDMVLTAGTRRADYAQLLLDLARSGGDRRLSWAAVSMARRSELEGRLLAILDPARNRRRLGRGGPLLAYLAATAMVLPLAAFQPTPTATPDGDGAPVTSPSVMPGPGIPQEVSGAASLSSAADEDASGPRTGPDAVDAETGSDNSPDPEPDPAPAPGHASDPASDEEPLERPAAGEQVPADTTEARLVSAMARVLLDERAALREQAAFTLGTMESPLGVEALSRAIGDESAEVRRQVAWALGMIESPDGVPALAGAVGDEDPTVREQATWALGMIESPEGVEALLPALGDESEKVREQAAWALGMIESSAAVERLGAALREDSSATVRSQAAWALGMIEDRAALEPLIDALEDESEEVARQAMWALGMIME